MVLDFKAAVFDMDGTIIDSLGIWEKIDYDFLEKKRIMNIVSRCKPKALRLGREDAYRACAYIARNFCPQLRNGAEITHPIQTNP